MKIFIDLETIKCQREDLCKLVTDNLKPPANYKSDEAIDKWMLANTEAAIDKTVFDGSYGEIITVGYAVNDSEINSLQRDDCLDESDILQMLFDELKIICDKARRIVDFTWVAHNAQFDLPYLKKRCIINRIDTHGIVIPTGRYDKHIFCTMNEWAGYGKYIKQGALAYILGIDGKYGDMTGADVGGVWEAGEYNRIAEYCRDDVRMVREIYNRISEV